MDADGRVKDMGVDVVWGIVKGCRRGWRECE